MSPFVILVGPPGSGKTTVAAALGARLGLTVRDTDDDIESATGATISDLFIRRGEDHFRVLETEAIALAVAEHEGILALGGGAVIRPGTRALLAGQRVVFLDVGLSAAAKRVGMNANRPLLLGNVRGTLKKLMDDRRPLYDEVATHTVVTDELSAEQVSARVMELVGKRT